MKRTTLLFLALCIGMMGFSQVRAPKAKDFKDIMVTREYKAPSDPEPPMSNYNQVPSGTLKSATLIGDETEIIETIYDLQSNTALGGRIWAWDDGTIGAVCTRGIQQPSVTGGFPDRGTGYNYFDGTTWAPKPTSRIETARTGWPTIAAWGPNGEIVFAHTATAMGFSKRETKGTGIWQFTPYPGPGAGVEPSWPRVVTSGDNHEYIHVVYNTYNAYQGQSQALLYSRSGDGGASWSPQDVVLDGMGSDYYLEISADDYVMAAKGNTVALLHVSAWRDFFIMKSTDNGETWEKIMIWEHPYPFFDLQTTLTSDTLYCPDNSANIAIDDNGMCHVVWGIGRVARLESAPPDPGSYNYWPYTDGIGYWNENMGQIPDNDNPHRTHLPEYLESLGMLCGWTQDVNNSGFIFDYEGTGDPQFATYRELGISTMPTITIDGTVIAVFYASTTETFVTADGLQNYKHIWARTSPDLGYTWGEFYDMQAGNIFHIYDECIYPVAAPNSPNGKFHIIYNADNIPGLFLDEDHDAVTNRIIYNGVAKDLIVGVNNPESSVTNFSVSQNYPNPASGITQIVINLKTETTVSVDIVNLTGQKVLEIPSKTMQAGNHTLSINAASFAPGVYFYTVTAGIETATSKMIVE
jgi:hypothetical protein